MSWKDNYRRMILRNKATGYAIYHCLLKTYRKHFEEQDFSGTTDRDITRISGELLVSERWGRYILCKYHLFYVILDEYFQEEGGREQKDI